ncbi:MAG: hypothetical protein KA270_17330 [Saprospiraceae bacterium]|nr:hypothetical protein [Saprospiraceae bacterium]
MKSLCSILLFVSLSLAVIGQTGARCGAMTTKGTPCKNRVKSEGLKCHHHAGNETLNGSLSANGQGKIIYTCGAETLKGTPCKRRVKIQGAKCFSHN